MITTTTTAEAPARRTSPAYGPAARKDSQIRHGVVAAFWTSLAFVTWLWAAGGGIGDLGSWETGLNSLGCITGLVAADLLLLVQVLLIARVPMLERTMARTGSCVNTGSSASPPCP